MKILLSLFALFPVAALAGSMTITYTRPVQFTDGSTLPTDVPLTYVIYAAPEGQQLTEVQRSDQLRQVVIVPAGRWCVQVYSVNGNVWADGAPNPPWCGTVPAAPTEPPPPTRKTRPAGNVVVTPSAEEPAQ